MAAIPARKAPGFASRLVAWQTLHGRHDLPWQKTRDPYRVWLSEIMLQQTQVSTVIGYYGKFLERFPGVRQLAEASQDDVLGLWSGLGYYSRARNLHRCAQAVCADHQGHFPSTALQLKTLPGIGPSTAAAIASLCFDERVTILDGNVRRVVSRYLGFDGDLSVAANERSLWDLAEGLLPDEHSAADMPTYTQALMDLGATLCTRSKPQCGACPFQSDCVALSTHQTASLPFKTKKLKRSAEAHWLLLARTETAEVMLEKRPQTGIWAGMYALPMFGSLDTLRQSLPMGLLGTHPECLQALPSFVHVLTHKDLHLHPVVVQTPLRWGPAESAQWIPPAQWATLGLPAPVRRLLESRD
jgi:A/G-specific adenine glycosylase